MEYVNKIVAVTLSLFFFLMCSAPSGLAAVEKKGSKIEIRMTKEVPVAAEPKGSTSQWVKKHKWWLVLGAVLAGGAAAAAGGGGGGGGGGDPDDGGTEGDGPITSSGTGSVIVGW